MQSLCTAKMTAFKSGDFRDEVTVQALLYIETDLCSIIFTIMKTLMLILVLKNFEKVQCLVSQYQSLKRGIGAEEQQ